MRPKHHPIKQLESFYQSYRKLRKKATKRTDTQKSREAHFVNQLPNLFDIAHQNALLMIKVPADREFLFAQREPGRRGSMASVDTVTTKREMRKIEIREGDMKRKCKAEQDMKTLFGKVELSGSENSNVDDTDDEDVTKNQQVTPTPKKRARKNLLMQTWLRLWIEPR